MQEQEKRQRGSGSIFHNGSNVWWIKFYVRGIPRRESSHSTDRKVAERLLKHRLAAVEMNIPVIRTNVRIDELIADLLGVSAGKAEVYKLCRNALEATHATILHADESGRFEHRHGAKLLRQAGSRGSLWSYYQPRTGHSEARILSGAQKDTSESQIMSSNSDVRGERRAHRIP